MATETYKRILIYNRVSTSLQASQLKTRLSAGEAFCSMSGLAVDSAFSDICPSTSLDRPGFETLLTYARQSPHQSFIVVIDRIDALSRDLTVFETLQQKLSNLGIEILATNLSNMTHEQQKSLIAIETVRQSLEALEEFFS